jgi:phosphotransferase system enzyme I (PtsI)
MTILTGRGVAPGVAVGRALVAVREARQVRYRLAASGVDRERQRLRAAREHTRHELEEISSRVARTIGSAQAAIFAAQLLMLDDPLLTRRADELIRAERINADWALERAVQELHDAFAREGDSWLRERVGDLSDVGGRLQRNLRPTRDPLVDLVQELEPPLVLVADELSPSTAAQIDWSRVRGLVSNAGGPTHHTFILVRSLGVPAVTGLAGATGLIAPGQTVAIDGSSGEVAIDPPEAIVDGWMRRADAAEAALRALDDLRDQPAVTADGVRVTLEANLEIADEVHRVIDAGAEGIGLYRSEFLLDAPSADGLTEDSQTQIYASLLRAMHPRPVTVRTFDIDEERPAGEPRTPAHRDRFGVRGVRAALHHDERFQTQIRALLRASAHGQLRILLPFVTSDQELKQMRASIDAACRQLGIRQSVPIGAMIEVPAAALTVDLLARHADFLSVGTNDLIQYTLAVDRSDERVASYYEPASPAVLRLLRTIADEAARTPCPVSVCGEIAADPALVGLLVGLGFRSFSMAPAAIPVVKRGLRSLDSQKAADVARQALGASSAEAARALLAPLVQAVMEHR